MAMSTSTQVKVTFINYDGQRETVDGVVGDTILQTAIKNEIPIRASCGAFGWPSNDYGEGPCCTDCRCLIPNEFLDQFTPMSEDERALLAKESDTTPNSRLSCQVKLTPGCDGIVCALPEYFEQTYWH